VTRALRPAERSYLDDESRAMIYQGASVNQLAELFKKRVPEVMRRLAGLAPVGTGRQGNPIYSVPEAAARLIRIQITEKQIFDFLTALNPKELPPLLNKAFWDAMRGRASYREQIGELWLTREVLHVASEAFQSLRMSLLLVPDTLRDETDIPEKYVLIVQQTIDDALEQARERLVDDLRKPGSGSRSRPDATDGEL
jgi:hypothetical protein